MARKRKYNYNGTLLNLALLGSAAILLKKRTGKLAGIGNNPEDTTIAIWGDSYLATEVMFYFGGWDSYKSKSAGGFKGYDLLYKSEYKAERYLEIGIQKIQKEYPNYRVDEYREGYILEYTITDYSRKRHITISLI